MKKVKRLSLFTKPTKIEYLETLTKYLGGPKIYIKRDDLTEVALGGNKVRKLEYLLADALSKKADLIITTGGPQSNHVRITAGICAKLGLKCALVLGGDKKEDYTGNLLLDRIFGAELHFPGVFNFKRMPEELEKIAESYRKKGFKPYIVPLGGASGIGTMGYAECFLETRDQLAKNKIRTDHIIVANGSGGTHAGLSIGKFLSRSIINVMSFSVLFKKEVIEETVIEEVNEGLLVLGEKRSFDGEISIDDNFIGKEYAMATPECLEAIKLMGEKEGIVLDPVYTGKGFAGIINYIRTKKFSKKENVLFIHTGGYPGIVTLTENDRRYFQ